MTDREIQKYFYSFFSNPSNTNDKKLPKITICAIMGNISKESSWRPEVIEAGTGIGFGLCQWSFGRRNQVEAYISKKLEGSAPSDRIEITVKSQCEFLWSELSGYNREVTGANVQWYPNPADSVDNGTGFYCSIEDFLAGNGDIEFLTAAFCYCWERPAYSTNHLFGEKDSRVSYAKKFFEDKELTNTLTIQPNKEDIELITNNKPTEGWFPTFYSYLNIIDSESNKWLKEIISAERLYIGKKETNKNKLYVKITDTYFLCIPFSYPSMDDYYFGSSTGNIRGTGNNLDYIDSKGKPHYCKNNQERNGNGYKTVDADRPFVLNNCVGAAWGLYNKTIHENVLEGNYTTYTRFNEDGGKCISDIPSTGYTFEVSKQFFNLYDLKGDFPTVGGLISWGQNGYNHVGFIACIINATELNTDANPDLKYIYVIESGYNSPGYTWVLRRYSSHNNYRGTRTSSTVYFLGTPINQTNSQIEDKIKIEQVGFNKIKISAPKKLFGYPFLDSILYDWFVPKEYNKDGSNFSGNTLDLKNIKFDPNDLSEEFSIEIKKLRRAYGMSLMIIYKNEANTLFSIEKESNTFTTSLPSLRIRAESNLGMQNYIPIGKDKKIFVPILKKDGHLYAYFNTDVERLD
jgi:hypothetical protein